MCFETKRLMIRPLEIGDYENWAKGYENRLPPQNEFDIGRVKRRDEKYYCKLIASLEQLAEDDKVYSFGAFDKVTGDNVGVMEIIVLLGSCINWGSIGVSVHNQFWRKGYGFEIVEEGISIAKNLIKLRRIECTIESGNEASVNLFKKLGFEFETVRKKFAYVGDKPVDMEVYVLIDD